MNIEKYNILHDELMKRLESGEITVEMAKEVHDLAFDKYITEGFFDRFSKKAKEEEQKKDEAIKKHQILVMK